METFLFGLTLSFTGLFSLEDGFDGLRTTPGVRKITCPAIEETHCTDFECDDATLHEDLPTGDREPSSEVRHPPNHSRQLVLSFTAQAQSNPEFTFVFPSSSSSGTRPAGQKGGRCSVCMKALCPRRHECNGSVNRAWCAHGHPPLQVNEKVRWSEVEVERRILASKPATGNC